MDNQERFKAQQGNSFFDDGRAMRPPVEGTIAQGDGLALGNDPHFYEGQNRRARRLGYKVSAADRG